ncbi:hypothetical protein K504DRAFT_533315 [Pleomassaria siparia CBS 279.74]|uniref:F-box domain-containing protein n=1 Tax=Pleomassaria siparia CBS 279.74 TaxID=1314801 RepID=A0A6G1KDC0_9PLEO|nr:hypothetical protein K504DRAFT_533315 [Pleomassaria siparia CBS 279.74]
MTEQSAKRQKTFDTPLLSGRSEVTQPAQSPLLRFLHPTHYAPIQHQLMQYLHTKDVLNLCRTSYQVRSYIKAGVWNINAKLGRFVDKPEAFRSQLGRCDGLISGSFALQFLERVVWNETHLDIWLENDDTWLDMDRYLEKQEGYVCSDSPVVRPDYMPAWEYPDCYTYHKQDQSGKHTTTIRLILGDGHPIQNILHLCCTSAVVNFISWNKVFSVFPRTTFLAHETVPLHPLDDHSGGLHAKYSKRGWAMRTTPVNSTLYGTLTEFRPSPISWTRYVGDRQSWVMPLNTDGVVGSPRPDRVLECAGWSMCCEKETVGDVWYRFYGTIRYTISAPWIRSNVLKYSYTYGSLIKLQDELERATLLQLTKLDTATRKDLIKGRSPADILAGQGGFIRYSRFEKPAGWDYWDHKLPTLLARLGQGDTQ